MEIIKLLMDNIVAAVVTFVVGTAVTYVFKLQKKVARLDKRINELAAEKEASVSKHIATLERLENYLAKGAMLGKLKSDVDVFLTKLLNQDKVNSISLYITREGSIYNFATLPVNNTNTSHHKNKVLPKNGDTTVGSVFLNKEIAVTSNNKGTVSAEYQRSEAGYGLNKTDVMATIPYKDKDGEVSFVLQIISAMPENELQTKVSGIQEECFELNKIMSQIFDTARWETLVPSLDVEKELAGSVIFFDLANSSLLLKDNPLFFAETKINTFIESMCNVAIKNGGVIDKYTGDGGFITFNLRQPVDQHAKLAVDSAIAMVKEMGRLRSMWRKFEEVPEAIVDKLKVRVGVSTGEMRLFHIGHPDYQYETYIGTPIHTAYHLCEGSDKSLRDRILVDSQMKDIAVSSDVIVEKYDPSNFSKSVMFSKDIFEIKPK